MSKRVDDGRPPSPQPRAAFLNVLNREFLVEQAIKAVKPAAQASATLQLPERSKAYDMQRARANVEAIYRELGR